MLGMRNVAGELTAAIKTFEECQKRNYKELHIYYDYAGIEEWCTGSWQARKKYTQDYVKKYNELIEGGVRVYFHKVEAHKNNKYNNEADKLAKKVLNL